MLEAMLFMFLQTQDQIEKKEPQPMICAFRCERQDDALTCFAPPVGCFAPPVEPKIEPKIEDKNQHTKAL